MSRIVMVVGPCGAGKSSVLRRMRPLLAPHVGEVATLETDTTYMMIDPTWELYSAEYWSLAVQVSARIAADFVREGFGWVAVGSNGLMDWESVDTFTGQLPKEADVFRVFLNPSVKATQARVAERDGPFDGHKTSGWVEENVQWMRTYHDLQSVLIDNTELAVDETVEAIFAAVEAGEGRIMNRPFSG